MFKKNRFKKFVGVLAFTCITFSLDAQQQGQFSQYMMNYFMINPALAGTEDQTDIRVGYRMQWAGLSGSPRNYYASFHRPIDKIHAKMMRLLDKPDAYHVMGGLVSGQTLGALSHNSAYLSYAYHLPLASDWIMSMGTMAGVNQFSVDANALDFGDKIADQAVTSGGLSKMKFDMSLGVWLYSPKMFFGLSSVQIFQNKLEFAPGIAKDARGMLNRHFYVTAGYKIKITEDVKVIPSVLLRQSSTAFQFDINTKVRYKDLFWAGTSYRRTDAIVLLAGVGIPLSSATSGSGVNGNGHGNNSRLEIGYSYDATTSRLNHYSKGSHEIMLALILPVGGRVICPGSFW